MPERANKKKQKIDSKEVQGKDSWVIMMTPTFEDYKAVETGVPTDDKDSDAMMNFGIALLKLLVDSWNWVDDEGEPLPDPSKNPEIIDALPLQELVFLVQALKLESVVKSKNLKKV